MRHLPPTHSFTHVEGADPRSVALEVAVATMVPQEDLRMMGADWDLECPLADTRVQARELQPRHVQREGCHKWRLGARLGLPVNGVRKLLTFLHAPCQVGFHPTMDTDASLGFSRIAHQSSAAAINVREAGKFALNRSVGTTFAPIGPHKPILRKGRKRASALAVTFSANVALPPTHALGDSNPLKVRGLALWKSDGPRTPQRSTACQFARTRG